MKAISHHILAALTPCVRWRYRFAAHEDQRHHRVVWALVNSSRHNGRTSNVADSVLVDPSLWGTSIIGLAVQCPDGKHFGSIRASSNVYNHVLQFLTRNYVRKLCEVMDAKIDISDCNSVVP